MGNIWTGSSDEKLENAFNRLLQLGGVDMSRVHTGRIDLNQDTSIEKDPELNMHYIEIRPPSKLSGSLCNLFDVPNTELPVLVMIHGFACGSASFYQLMGELSNYYHIYSIDVIGQGYSGRPNFNLTNVDEVEEYFLKHLKLWKDRVGLGDQKVTLLGHSMGGYFSIIYALRHPQEVQKLILLSPAGIPEKPEDFTQETIIEMGKSKLEQMLLKLGIFLWNKSMTPQDLLRIGGRYMGGLLYSAFLSELKVPKEEKDAQFNYSFQVHVRKASTERAIMALFELGGWAKKPLHERMLALKEYHIPVFQYYGEFDFIDSSKASDMIKKGDLYGVCDIISKDDHYLMANPEELLYKIILDVFGPEEADHFAHRKDQKLDFKSLRSMSSICMPSMSTQDALTSM